MSQIIGKVGMTPRGMYERTRAYERLDVVTYQGSSWVAIVDVPAQISPALGSDYWQLQARMGETGPQGPVGPQGNSAFDGTGVELVNNLTQGGEAAALSAEQGKILKQELTELESEIDAKLVELDYDVAHGYRHIHIIPNSYVVKADGSLAPADGWSSTDFIKVDSILELYISGATSYCWWYDADKRPLAQFTIANAGNVTLSVPANATYCRISKESAIVESIRIKSEVLEYLNDVDGVVKMNRQNIIELDYAQSIGERLVPIISDCYILKDSGEEYPFQGWSATDFIKAIGGLRLYSDAAMQYCCWYAADKSYLSNFTINGGWNNIVVPDGATYCRLSAEDGIIASVVIKGNEKPTESEEEVLAKINYVPSTSVRLIQQEMWANPISGYIDESGKVISYNGYRVSQPIKVEKGDKVTITLNGINIAMLAHTNKASLSIGDVVSVIHFERGSVNATKTITHTFTEDTYMVVGWNYVLDLVRIESDSHYREYATQYHNEEDAIIEKLILFQDFDFVKFLLHTDNHYWDNTAGNNEERTLRHCRAFAKMASEFATDFQINLGDLVMNADTSFANKGYVVRSVTKMQDSNVPFLYVEGNHEVWEGYGELSKNVMFGATGRFSRYINKHYNNADTNKMYYYFDNELAKIRMYCLDSSSDGNYGYSSVQVEWLNRTLSELPTDYKVVIFTHIPFYQGALCSTEKNSGVPSSMRGQNVRDILKPYVENGLDILAVIHGHNHWDLVVFDAELKCPNICTTSEHFEPVETQEEWKCPNQLPLCPERVDGEYSEYACDIFNVSRTSGVIDILRFGAGKSRKIHLASVNVTDSVTLASSLANPTWRTSSEAIASVSNGVVTKVASGSATIQAETDTDVEIWHILVA